MKLLGVVGSLRAASYNAKLLAAAAAMLADGVELEVFDGLADIPPYDREDREDASAPAGSSPSAASSSCRL